MFKNINSKLLFAGGLVLLLSACSSKEATIGDKMMQSAQRVQEDANEKEALAIQWKKGSELVKKGKEQKEEGEEMIEEGEDLVDDGKDNIKEGEELIETSEKIYKKKFPGVALMK